MRYILALFIALPLMAAERYPDIILPDLTASEFQLLRLEAALSRISVLVASEPHKETLKSAKVNLQIAVTEAKARVVAEKITANERESSRRDVTDGKDLTE